MRRILIGLIKVYQYLISPLIGPHCRFYPSCSHYAVEAIEHHGLAYGSYLAVRRISRCHPWHPGGIDPVPHERQTTTHGKPALVPLSCTCRGAVSDLRGLDAGLRASRATASGSRAGQCDTGDSDTPN